MTSIEFYSTFMKMKFVFMIIFSSYTVYVRRQYDGFFDSDSAYLLSGLPVARREYS